MTHEHLSARDFLTSRPAEQGPWRRQSQHQTLKAGQGAPARPRSLFSASCYRHRARKLLQQRQQRGLQRIRQTKTQSQRLHLISRKKSPESTANGLATDRLRRVSRPSIRPPICTRFEAVPLTAVVVPTLAAVAETKKGLPLQDRFSSRVIQWAFTPSGLRRATRSSDHVRVRTRRPPATNTRRHDASNRRLT